MQTVQRVLAGAVLLALAVVAAARADEAVSYSGRIAPLLEQYCVMCHLPGDEQGGLSLYPDGWAAMVGVPSKQSPLRQVEPGIPEKSYLYVKMLGTQDAVGGSGQRMPIQQEALGAADMEAFRQWILQGAKKD